jgi:hypothetical protein
MRSKKFGETQNQRGKAGGQVERQKNKKAIGAS